MCVTEISVLKSFLFVFASQTIHLKKYFLLHLQRIGRPLLSLWWPIVRVGWLDELDARTRLHARAGVRFTACSLSHITIHSITAASSTRMILLSSKLTGRWTEQRAVERGRKGGGEGSMGKRGAEIGTGAKRCCCCCLSWQGTLLVLPPLLFSCCPWLLWPSSAATEVVVARRHSHG